MRRAGDKMKNLTRRFGWMCCAGTALALLTGCPPDTGLQTEGTFFEPVEVGSFEVSREPRLRGPSRIDFGKLERGESASRQLEISNDGRAPLEIGSWALADASFRMEFPGFADGAPARIEPGQSVVVVITYTASGEGGQRGELLIESNDPKSRVWVVDLVANLVEPCLEVSEKELDFGSVSPNGSRTLALEVSNCSDGATTTFGYSIPLTTDATGFEVLEARSLREVSLEPGERREIEVRFAPPRPGQYRDVMRLSSNVNGGSEHEVLLLGEGSEFGCPSAVITMENTTRQGATVVAKPYASYAGRPLDTLGFNSQASSAEGGASIERVEWSLIKRPEDSSARLAPDSQSLYTSMFLDLSGDYTIELEVWDSRGMRSCQPARLDVQAIPNEDIHIQLVWDTPNDPEQLDSFGTDVDVHLLRAGGFWNAKPWDCYWQNLSPDWGRRNDPTDDPSLDIDDVDGWGPENINLNNPESGMSYHVGVHYFSDQGYGASYATVRVYVGGVVVNEIRRKRMTDQQFWHVLDVDWPSGEITTYDDIYLTFPQGVFPPMD